MVVINTEGKVLVEKQWIGTGKWQLPGGGLHKGESTLHGACRELAEETGVQLAPEALQDLGSAQCHDRGHTFTIYVFAAKVGDVTLRRQRIELSDVVWLDPATLNSDNTRDDVLTALGFWRKLVGDPVRPDRPA